MIGTKNNQLADNFSGFVRDLSRFQKRIAMMVHDFMLVMVALWAAVSLRLGDMWPEQVWMYGWWLLLVVPIITVMILYQLQVYRQVLRSIGLRSVIRILQAIAIATLCFVVVGFFFRNVTIPRSTPIIFLFIAMSLLIGSRWLALNIYRRIIRGDEARRPVIIYGAGAAGLQLLAALKDSDDYNPVAFIDDDPRTTKSLIEGRRIYARESLDELISRFDVQDVLLAMPSVNNATKREILYFLSERQLRVKEVPPIQDMIKIASGEAKLRAIEIEDLVGRAPVPPDQNLFSYLQQKNVLLTGAGGSIGSELCRQIIRCSPKVIVLYEMNEFALYSIDRELRGGPESASVTIIPVLGSVCDGTRLSEKLSEHKINILFHAAAYKHVPLVEANPLEGVRNNTIGTYEVAKAAVEQDVERVILISTDKAVRPTNMMGASKRMAEWAFQLWQHRSDKTNLSMVRFGNVMGSSGSVIPLFKEQIEAGGPITVTHQDVVRYFMTIPEAAQLVIQAGGLSSGGDVFLLDMGDPVSILDLARRMIHLAGHNVKDETNPQGEIQVHFSGLRPGEKLFEEMLIDDKAIATSHSKIMKEVGVAIDFESLQTDFDLLMRAVTAYDHATVRNILNRHVEGFRAVSVVK